MKHNKIRDIYLARVNGCWGGLITNNKTRVIINAKEGLNLKEFVTLLKEDFPGYRLRCVKNLGIEEYIKKYQMNYINKDRNR